MPPLRVLHVLADAPGGTMRYVRRLEQAADRPAVQPRVLLLGIGDRATGARSAGATGCWRIMRADVLDTCRSCSDLVLRLRTLRTAARRADVVVTHAGHGGLWGRLAAWAAGRPAVHVVHNWPGNGPNTPRWRRSLLRLLDMVLTLVTAVTVGPSHAVIQKVAGRGLARCGRSVTVHFALGGERSRANTRGTMRRALGIPETAPVIIFAGRFDPVKGAPAFVAAAIRMAAEFPGLVALVVGDGAEAPAVRAAAAGHPELRLLGWREDVPQLMAAADLAVIPSYSETFGIVAVEALDAGTPVVGYRVGGLPEAVGPGGLLVPVGDHAALCSALAHLLRDDQTRDRLSRLGRRWVAARYRGDAWVRRHEALWRRVAQAGRAC